MIILSVVSCQKDVTLAPINIEECMSMPTPTASGTWFAYDNKIYLLGGRTADGKYSKEYWQYTPSTDQWQSLGEMPIKARVSASACIVGDCAYIGLGYSGPIHRDNTYLRDFWELNLITNDWTRLADFPANTTVKNCLFATNDHIYATYGFYRQFTQDIYQYSIPDNEWKKLDIEVSRQIPRAMDVVGATCQGRHFLGTGFNHGSLRFWAEWIPKKQQLVRCKDILGTGRNAAACCATDGYVYLAGGRHYGDTLTTGFFYSSIQRYDPSTNQWEYIGNMPYEAENMVAIGIKKQLFIGLGETRDGVIQDKWYKIEEQ